MSYICTACTSAGIILCDHTCADCDEDGKHDSPDCPVKKDFAAKALAIGCPVCRAAPGVHCIDPGHAGRTHFKRRAAAGEFKPPPSMGDVAIEELRQIKSYLGHTDQDANHAWMVRRIDAVLTGKDPGKVVGWTEFDGVREAPTCPDCGQPMLPPGETKRPNEYDHVSGCPRAPAPPSPSKRVELDAAELTTLEDVFDWYIDDDNVNAHRTDAARRLYAKLTKP